MKRRRGGLTTVVSALEKLLALLSGVAVLTMSVLACCSAGAANQFKQPPSVRKEGDGCAVSFEVEARCDVTVAVIDPQRMIVRRLASGVLGENAPRPLARNSPRQTISWDGKTDAGRPAPDGCRVQVAPGLKPSFGSGCVCKTCRIGLDGFSRSFAPIYHLSCVMVLDSNFNPVLRVGTYRGPIEENGRVCHVPELGMSRPAPPTLPSTITYFALPTWRTAA